VTVYIIQAEKNNAKKLMRVAERNEDLKLVKALFITNNKKLVAILKRHYNITVLKQDLIL
jgi:hypothetical protein